MSQELRKLGLKISELKQKVRLAGAWKAELREDRAS